MPPPRMGAVVSVLQAGPGGLPVLDDFNVGLLPSMRAEMWGLNLFSRLREFPRPVTFVGPRRWTREVLEAAPVRTVTTATCEAASSEVLPPQEARPLSAVAGILLRAVQGWSLHKPMPLAEAREIRRVSRSSFLSHSSFTSWA